MSAHRHDWDAMDPQLRKMIKAQYSVRRMAEELAIPAEAVRYRMGKLALKCTAPRGGGARAGAASAFDPPKGRMPALNYLPPDELQVDPSYQRSIEGQDSQRLIGRIARQWDWAKCLPLLVSAREGGDMFVIDGQHRLTAARVRGDIAQLPCVVVSVGGCAGEAALFDAVNTQRRALAPLELFRASLASGDAEAAAILAAIEGAGLTLAPHTNYHNWAPGMVSHIGTIRQSWQQHGERVTRAALGALAQGFAGQVLQYGGTIFAGLPQLIADGRGDDLGKVLATKSQESWRGLILAARAEDVRLNWKSAAQAVIAEAIAAAGAKGAVDPGRFVGGKAWCNQCDMKVTLGQAQGCKSRYCAFKRAERPAQVAA